MQPWGALYRRVRQPDDTQVMDTARVRTDHPIALANAFAVLAIEVDDLWAGDPERRLTRIQTAALCSVSR